MSLALVFILALVWGCALAGMLPGMSSARPRKPRRDPAPFRLKDPRP